MPSLGSGRKARSMRLRSLLFVPGDRPERFEKALASGSDAIILDLEDSVAPERKEVARAAVRQFLSSPASAARFVRINPLGSGLVYTDLAAAIACDGLVLPKAEGAASVVELRRRAGSGCPPILPIATETPAAIFQLGSFAGCEGLAGLTWGAEDLPAAIGAATSREADGRFTPPYEMARSLALFAAHAAGVPAIDTVYPDIADGEGLRRYAERGARDGFAGMMAIHPAQVPVINRAFSPSEGQLVAARRLVDAFAAAPGIGALQIDGRMVDAPHLHQARAILARAQAGSQE